jgi:hypothetical protein
MFAKIPPIPVPHVLNNSHMPSPSEVKLIQATIREVHRDIQLLNHRIDGVRTLLFSLMHNRDMLCRYSYFQQSLLSPAPRLPPEILSEIFLTCLAVDPSCEDRAFPRRKEVLLFGQVCRYWRNISTSTSRLWSALKIDLRIRNMKREMVVAMTWLGRSGGAPLSIKLCSHDEMTPAHPITDVLLGHGPRLYMLHSSSCTTVNYPQFSEPQGSISTPPPFNVTIIGMSPSQCPRHWTRLKSPPNSPM